MSVVIRGTTSAGANGSAAVSSLAISSPSGTVSGDLLLLEASWQSATPTITIPTGWTQLDSSAQANTNNISVLMARVADGTATDSPTVTLSASANLTLVMIGLGSWNGIAVTSLTVANTHTGTASTTISFPAITPSTSADLLVYLGALRPSATATQVTFSTTPAGGTGGTVTKQQDICTARTGSNVDSQSAIFTQQLTSSAAVAAGTATCSTVSQGNEYAVIISPSAGNPAGRAQPRGSVPPARRYRGRAVVRGLAVAPLIAAAVTGGHAYQRTAAQRPRAVTAHVSAPVLARPSLPDVAGAADTLSVSRPAVSGTVQPKCTVARRYPARGWYAAGAGPPPAAPVIGTQVPPSPQTVARRYPARGWYAAGAGSPLALPVPGAGAVQPRGAVPRRYPSRAVSAGVAVPPASATTPVTLADVAAAADVFQMTSPYDADVAGAADLLAVTASVPVADVAGADEWQYADGMRQDAAAAAEALSVAISAAVADVAAAADLASGLSRPVADVAGAADAWAAAASVPLADAAGAADSVASAETANAVTVAETAGAAEALQVQKPFTGPVAVWAVREAPPRWHAQPAGPRWNAREAPSRWQLQPALSRWSLHTASSRWRIIMAPFEPISALSPEDINVTWTSDLDGTVIDPTTAGAGGTPLTVKFAFPASSGNALAPAQPVTWYTGSWLAAGTAKGFVAQCPVGPGQGTITFTSGASYDVWSQVLNAGSESPIKFAGTQAVY